MARSVKPIEISPTEPTETSIYVIGLGGIGSWLLQGLCPFLAYRTNEKYRIHLIDGDDYEDKNRSRQAFSQLGPKANVQAKWVLETFPNLSVSIQPFFLGSKENASRPDRVRPVEEVIEPKDGPTPVLFLCVDNHRTRKYVSDFAQKLPSVLLISGGNEFTDGNVQTFWRADGKNYSAPLDAFHPEIEKPSDKPPFELSCEELAKSSPQLILSNLQAACTMLAVFYGFIAADPDWDGKAEWYFDVLSGQVAKVPRPVKGV